MNQSELILSRYQIDAVGTVSEDQLLVRLRSGEHAAFDQLYDQFHELVYNLAYRVLGDREEAFDITQEVYLSIFRNVDGFHGGSSLKTWIYRITVNACLNRNRWWKRRMRNSTVSLSEFRHGQGRHPLPEADRGKSSPENIAYNRELERQLQKSLNRLPKDQRIAVILRDLEGLTYEEIAESLNISKGTVKSRIARGRQGLRNDLRGYLT